MRYHLFLPLSTHGDVHAALVEAYADCYEYDFLIMNNGWTACRARLRHEDAVESLEAKGWIVWDHITDHTARLEDRHHVGVVDAAAGIETGDTPLVAARKLHVHLGGYKPFRPVMVF